MDAITAARPEFVFWMVVKKGTRTATRNAVGLEEEFPKKAR